jgi:hypothetical protein
MGFNVLILQGEINASLCCMGSQFICTNRPHKRCSNEQTFWNLQFEFCSYRAVIDHVACTTRLRIKLISFFNSNIFTRNRKQLSHSSAIFFSCLRKLQHTVTIDSSCLIQTSLRISIAIKKTIKLLSCSFRPYNTNFNLNSN